MGSSLLRARTWPGWWLAATLALGGCGMSDFKLGETLQSQHRWDDAIRAYEQAIAREPGNAEYKAALAKVRAAAADAELKNAPGDDVSRISDVDRGLAAVERALRYDPGHGASLARQTTLRERRAVLFADLQRALAEVQDAAAARDWTRVVRAANRALAIDPASAEAARWRQEALVAQAGRAEAVGDWREAARFLQEALAPDPSNDRLQARLRTAQERDRHAIYVAQATEAETAGNLGRAFTLLRTALKYFPADAELQKAAERVAVDGRRRHYGEAIQSVRKGEWGRVYASLADSAESFGAPSHVVPSLRPMADELLAKLYARANEFEGQRLWGNALLWLQAVDRVDPLYRDTTARIDETRERLVDRVTLKLAVPGFESPRSAPDAGSIFQGSLVTSLLRLERRDVRVIEREKLEAIVRELSTGAQGVIDVETVKQVGRIAGIDVFLLGNVLQYRVDQSETEGRKSVMVPRKRSTANPAYERHMTEVRQGRGSSDPPPPTIQEEVEDLVTYRTGTVTSVGYASVSFRIVGVERGEIRLAEKVDVRETITRDYSEGVEPKGIMAVPKQVPIPTEMLNRVTDQAVTKIVQLVGQHFGRRQETYFEAGRDFQRRRQSARAVEEYMNCITTAELEGSGAQFASRAGGLLEELLRQ